MALSDADRFLLYSGHPWYFLMDCVYTLDQVNQDDPIKTLPDKEYARLYVDCWVKYPMLVIPKTRRMTMSWFTVGLYVWDTIFHRARAQAFVSKKEDDADELVKRAVFIIEHIPESCIPKEYLPPWEKKFCSLEFPTINSSIKGYPQGADQLRQFTFSGIFGDESAFWDQAKKFYSASRPTIDGGGRMTLVSSPAPGFFKALVFDAIDSPVDMPAVTPEKVSYPMQGVRIWMNPKNRFMVFELHYTADPKKRSPEYKESVKASMPLMEYLREYELHWDTFEGFPVYPEFSKLHKTREKPEPMAGLPMVIGFDFGLTPAAIIAQLQEETLFVFEELVEINMGSDRFAAKVKQHILLNYRTKTDLKKDWLCFVDPAGLARNQKDETACAQSLSDVGFVPAPGPVIWEVRRKAVVSFLKGMSTTGPSLQVYEPGCPILVKGFEGGYKYSEKQIEIESAKLLPVKDAFSHPHDAFQYLCWGVKGAITYARKAISRPEYSITASQVRKHG